MKIAIIGAGFTGITAAYDLKKAGHSVTLFEASPQAGGLASGFKAPHWAWFLEKTYHHWFASDSSVKQLLTANHLAHKLIFSRPSTVVYANHHFYPLDSPLNVIRFPGLNLPEKFRFAAATAYLKSTSSWHKFEAIPAANWLSQVYGPKTYQLIWEPLLQGKFGRYYHQVSMAWMWARLKKRTLKLGTYQGGFQACVDDLLSILNTLGVVVQLNTPVMKLQIKPSGVRVQAQSFPATTFDTLLLTSPPQITHELAPFLPVSYLKKILTEPYLSALTLILSLIKPLSPEGHYWYNLPKNQGFPFLALVEHTNFVSPTHFGGDHLVYCADYVLPNDPYLSLNKDALIDTFMAGIQKINPLFNRSWIKNSWVFQVAYAQPLPDLYHSHHLPSIKSPIKGVYVANMAQVYPWDRGTNYAIDLGHQAAQTIIKS